MNVGFVFLHSGCIGGGFTPTLAHVQEDGKYLKGNEGYLRRVSRGIKTAELGCKESVENCLLVADVANAEIYRETRLWMAKVPFLFKIEMNG